MKRTHPSAVIGLLIAGLVAGFLFETAVVGSGHPMLVPPIAMAVTLAAIGVIVMLLAWPIRRAVRSTVKTHIDPFRALRIAVLAKASALVGALLTGAGGGILVYLLTRTVLPGGSSIVMAASLVGGGIVLLIGGLVGEYFCTLPPPSDGDQPHGGDPHHA